MSQSTIILPPNAASDSNTPPPQTPLPQLGSGATPPPPADPPPPVSRINTQRVFMYQGQTYQDPGAGSPTDWPIERVRNLLAQTYPELANATWTETPQSDGSVLIEFVKVTGEKGQQASFFDEQTTGFPPRQQQPAQSSSPPNHGPTQRVFIVNGQVWGDPGPEYTIIQIRDSFAQTYPELTHATWTSRLTPNGTEEITFVKVSGEKGHLTDD